MRHLLNTLYVTTPEYFLSLDGGNVVVSQNNKEVAKVPLITLESIVCFTHRGATPALMGECAEKGIDLVFFNPYGKFLARTVGEERGNILLRAAQYRIADAKSECCLIARNMLLGKVYNSKWIIERTTRDHEMRVNKDALKKVSSQLSESMLQIKDCTELDTLRGLEGESAQRYFSVFSELILQQEEDFPFKGRNRRPPLDNVNALLSFAYALLANCCAAALISVGLDPYMGFMHRMRPGRKSLALDLMEELRPVMADRVVITCINQHAVKPDDFVKQESGAVVLTETGRRSFLKAWQQKKQETLRHPFLKDKIEWGLVPYVQAQLLAKTLREDLDEYPPFFWK